MRFLYLLIVLCLFSANAFCAGDDGGDKNREGVPPVGRVPVEVIDELEDEEDQEAPVLGFFSGVQERVRGFLLRARKSLMISNLSPDFVYVADDDLPPGVEDPLTDRWPRAVHIFTVEEGGGAVYRRV